jgi:hypothetical protein
MALIGSNIFIGNNDEQMFIGTDRYDKTTEPTFVGIITASDGAQSDYFGNSVAVGSGRIVVGAWGNDDNGSASGSAYIFDLDGNEVGIITASDGAADDRFGYSVAVGSGRIVVGAYRKTVGLNDDQGGAYIFDLDGNEVGIITASDGAAYDRFGYSVAVGSGRIVVGAWGNDDNGEASGSAYIFDLDGNEVGIITASDGAADDRFGYSVAVGSGRIVVGAYWNDIGSNFNQGSAYIFDLDGNEVGIITASDGSAYDEFGNSVAVGSGRIVVGAWGNDDNGEASGSAYIFDLDGNEVGIITASDGAADDYFGNSVAVGSGRIVVGAYRNDIGSNFNQGSAYIFDLDGNEVGIITASDGAAGDFFGYSVAVGSGRIVVGASWRDSDSVPDMGAIYIYDTPKSDHIIDILDI